jgi:hypothetical protein
LKLQQLQQMNLVYFKACLTIVAASGHHGESGLPGVSSVPRSPKQPRAQVGEYLLVSEMSFPRDLIESSVWSTRGWTFQEGLLSSRRLVFTEEQVYLECQEAGYCETAGRVNGQREDEVAMRRIYPWDILRHISMYTRRELTYEDDILNAFLGILAFYRKTEYPIYHHWGVPILTAIRERDFIAQQSYKECFLAGLRWACVKPGDRRAGSWPTWSWTAWKVSVTYDSAPRFGDALQNGESTVQVFLEYEPSPGAPSLLQFEACLPALLSPSNPFRHSRYINLLADVIPLRFERDAGGAYWATFDIADRTALQLPLELLCRMTDDLRERIEKGELTGFILGPSRICRKNNNIFEFVLVTQNTGHCHERIGHLAIDHSGQATIVTEQARAIVSPLNIGKWDLSSCFRNLERRMTRLG